MEERGEGAGGGDAERRVSTVTLVQAVLLGIALVLSAVAGVIHLRAADSAEEAKAAELASGFGGPGGFPGGGFGRGGPAAPERKLVAQFDTDGDDRLDRGERLAAREWLEEASDARFD